ncbi:hypothetical protein ACFWP3_37770 [Streptomyces sp. NPDC058525]
MPPTRTSSLRQTPASAPNPRAELHARADQAAAWVAPHIVAFPTS